MMRIRRFVSVLGVFLCMVLSVSTAMAERTDPKETFKSDEPIDITSNELEVHRAEGYAIFRGNVFVKQDNWELRAEKVTVFYAEAQRDVSSLRAERNVRFKSELRRATAEVAIYTRATDTLVMQGNPVIYDGDNMLKGEQITYQVTKDIIKVKRATGRIDPQTTNPEKKDDAGKR